MVVRIKIRNIYLSFFPSINQSTNPNKILTTKNCLLPFKIHVNVVVAIKRYAVNGKSTEYLYKVLNTHTQLTRAKKKQPRVMLL